MTKEPISAKDFSNAFDLTDGDGRRFVRDVDATLAYWGEDYPNTTADLNPGLSRALWLVFDVPTDAIGFALVSGDDRLVEVPA